MKKIIIILLLTLIGWSNALNAQWLTNNTSWVSTSLNVTNPTYVFDNNEATASSISCPNHTETWGSVEINLNQSVAIDSVRYKWTRRDRKYDYSQGVACWFKTRLSYYNSTSSKWVVFMTDSLDTSADNGSVSTRTGWSYKKTSLNVTASKFKLEIGAWWWWVNSVDFSISEFYMKSKSITSTDGLVAYYPFSGNANDASGNANNGTVSGAILTKDRFGNTNSAYNFNGVSNKITFSKIPMSVVDNWSISAWIKPTVLPQLGLAVLLGYDIGINGTGYGFGIGMGSGEAIGSKLTGLVSRLTWSDPNYTFTSPNQWYHIVMLRQNGVLKYYVNSILFSTNTTSSPYIPTDFMIGSRNNGCYFNGVIDDIRIYNRVLSNSEVSTLYNENSPNVSNCNFITNSASWLGTADITNATNIIDNNKSTFGYVSMSNYSTTYIKSALINFRNYSAPSILNH